METRSIWDFECWLDDIGYCQLYKIRLLDSIHSYSSKVKRLRHEYGIIREVIASQETPTFDDYVFGFQIISKDEVSGLINSMKHNTPFYVKDYLIKYYKFADIELEAIANSFTDGNPLWKVHI